MRLTAKNLEFGEELKDEANRMRREEIATLNQKHDSLKEEMSKIEEKLANFAKDYFAELD